MMAFTCENVRLLVYTQQQSYKNLDNAVIGFIYFSVKRTLF